MSAAVMGRFVEAERPRKSGMVAAVFWGSGLLVASLGAKLRRHPDSLAGLWGAGWDRARHRLHHAGLDPGEVVSRTGAALATGLAIMGFGFGAAIGGPVYNYIMSDVAAGQAGDGRGRLSGRDFQPQFEPDDPEGAIHVKDEATAGYGIDQLFDAVRAGRNEEVLGMLPAKLAQDAEPTLVELNAALTNSALAPFWRSRLAEVEERRRVGHLRRFPVRGPGIPGDHVRRRQLHRATAPGVDAGQHEGRRRRWREEGDSDLTQMAANAAIRRAPFYGLWVMMFINISCGIGIIYTASPLAQESIGLTPPKPPAWWA